MHDMTGVRRAWRGRGIARALKAAEIAWAKESGYERLETQNEERNEPIRRLNERYGYVVHAGLGDGARAVSPKRLSGGLERALHLPLRVPLGEVAPLVDPLLAARRARARPSPCRP